MTDIEILQNAIFKLHGCRADHIGTAPVMEALDERPAWEGDVEVFNLPEHPFAKRCYAWSYVDKAGKQTRIVLELPPVVSARTAVRLALAEDLEKDMQAGDL